MAPPYCMDLALVSSGLNPTCVLAIPTASLIALEIFVLLVMDHFFLWYIATSFVWLTAMCCQRCAIWHRISATAHDLVCPVFPCLIDYSLNPFF